MRIPFLCSLLLLVMLLPGRVMAGSFELSFGFSFTRTAYTNNGYEWVRRWGSSVGYHFTDRSGIELGFQDIVDRSKIPGYEDATFHDQVYSVNWVQDLTGKNFPIQPYFKVGIGQLNREYTNGPGSPSSVVDEITGVLGAGLRIYITRSFAIRGEATSYLSRGSIRTWKDDVATSLGVSFQF